VEQVTICIVDETEAKMTAAAKSKNVSKSKWITSAINDKLTNQWPRSVIELAICWLDFPTLEEIPSGSPKDAKRQTL
jgi:hypothetical protein